MLIAQSPEIRGLRFFFARPFRPAGERRGMGPRRFAVAKTALARAYFALTGGG
jgi:hypothetical protein